MACPVSSFLSESDGLGHRASLFLIQESFYEPPPLSAGRCNLLPLLSCKDANLPTTAGVASVIDFASLHDIFKSLLNLHARLPRFLHSLSVIGKVMGIKLYKAEPCCRHPS